jgi:hypothetical protein
MKNNNTAIKTLLIIPVFISMFLVLNTHVHAQNLDIKESTSYPTVIDSTVNLEDPQIKDVTLLILSVIRFMIGFAGGFTILMLVYAGFQYTSGYMTGSEDGSNEGKSTMFHAIIGLILILTSYLIVTMFQSALTSSTFN